jgi:acetate kinase
MKKVVILLPKISPVNPVRNTMNLLVLAGLVSVVTPSLTRVVVLDVSFSANKEENVTSLFF